ncbi:MAG TPA: hypothetical protein VEC08_04370 [Nitrososphaerales archaeon]|nr:hypothetical protein [Nitrososphaerales archaeon]
MARLSPAAIRGLSDYLYWLETEYDIRIEARDLNDNIHENMDLYQAEFDSMVRDFYYAVNEIEKEAFRTCDSIEEDEPTDADEKMNEVLGEARERILKESGRLAERLNSMNLQSSRWLPSINDDVGPPRVEDNVISQARFQFLCTWTCAEGCERIEGAEEYERHRTFNPNHHPHVSDDVGPPRDGRQALA